MKKKFISVVIPVYKSVKVLPITLDNLLDYLNKSDLVGRYEIILVDDRSPDDVWTVIQDYASKYQEIKGVRFLKNYGQHTAMYCGFQKAKGDYVVTMDDDMQNPPREIEKLIAKATEGYDLVFGKFYQKKHSVGRRLGTKIVGYLNKKIFSKPSDVTLSNFRIVRKDLVERMLKYKTMQPYIPGLLLLFAENISNVLVEHKPRTIGTSNYSLLKIMALVGRILFNYSSFPLKTVSYFGVFASFSSLCLGLYYLLYALFKGINVPGWSTVIVLMSMLNGLILLILGLVGEYLSRIITENSNAPAYSIVSEVGIHD